MNASQHIHADPRVPYRSLQKGDRFRIGTLGHTAVDRQRARRHMDNLLVEVDPDKRVTPGPILARRGGAAS